MYTDRQYCQRHGDRHNFYDPTTGASKVYTFRLVKDVTQTRQSIICPQVQKQKKAYHSGFAK